MFCYFIWPISFNWEVEVEQISEKNIYVAVSTLTAAYHRPFATSSSVLLEDKPAG